MTPFLFLDSRILSCHSLDFYITKNNGRLDIDNNRTERSIKPFVIARKNFLFCIAPHGAKASAITFSLIESAKENSLKPFEYLKYLLEELPNIDNGDLSKFMPWSDEIPENCRTLKRS